MTAQADLAFREIGFGSAEYEAALALREAVLRAPLGLPLSEHDRRGESQQLHFGLFDDAALVACVTAVPLPPAEAKIRQTAVEPRFQGRGAGSLLMRKLEAGLAAKGFTRLSLHARSSAIGFYEKLGYRVTGEEFIEVTIPHRRMEKSLS